MSIKVKVGACQIEGIEDLKRFKKEDLGNFVYLSLIKEDIQKSIEMAKFCKENAFYFVLSEFRSRGTLEILPGFKGYKKGVLEKIIKAGGDYFVARSTMGENGRQVYHLPGHVSPKETGVMRVFALPQVDNMQTTKESYVKRVKKGISLEKQLSGKSPLMMIGASIFHRYHLEAGIDRVYLEVMPGDPNLMLAALRGASKAYQRKDFGAHIAMSWYGGVKIDELFFSRWKTSLYFSYLSGADPIYSESGHWDLKHAYKGNYDFQSKECQRFREILREFYQFCQTHPRPEKGPKVTLGFVQGNLDGNPGFWNKQAWGQYKGKQWSYGAPEEGWNYINKVFKKEEWFNPNHTGKTDFSGNPPYGQIDIVPTEAPLEVLNNYSSLVFLGWNTMTKELYDKLKAYVRKGGHLLMSIPHLSNTIKREEDLKLYNNGDYQELFGVVVKGKGKRVKKGIRFIADSSLASYRFPNRAVGCDPEEFTINGNFIPAKLELRGAKVLARLTFKRIGSEKNTPPLLIENSLGKGKSFLITTWDYPGERNLKLFMEEVIKVINIGEQADIRLESSDKVRYAVYEEKGLKTVYLLNTDFSLPQSVKLHIKDKVFPLEIKENELRIVWLNKDLAISPKDKSLYLESLKIVNNRYLAQIKGKKKEKISLLWLNEKLKKVEFKFTGGEVKEKNGKTNK